MLYARKCNIKRIVQRDPEELRRISFFGISRLNAARELRHVRRGEWQTKTDGGNKVHRRRYICVDKLNVRRHFCSRTSRRRRYNNYNMRTCAQDIIILCIIGPLHRCLMASCCTLHTHTHTSHC